MKTLFARAIIRKRHKTTLYLVVPLDKVNRILFHGKKKQKMFRLPEKISLLQHHLSDVSGSLCSCVRKPIKSSDLHPASLNTCMRPAKAKSSSSWQSCWCDVPAVGFVFLLSPWFLCPPFVRCIHLACSGSSLPNLLALCLFWFVHQPVIKLKGFQTKSWLKKF